MNCEQSTLKPSQRNLQLLLILKANILEFRFFNFLKDYSSKKGFDTNS